VGGPPRPPPKHEPAPASPASLSFVTEIGFGSTTRVCGLTLSRAGAPLCRDVCPRVPSVGLPNPPPGLSLSSAGDKRQRGLRVSGDLLPGEAVAASVTAVESATYSSAMKRCALTALLVVSIAMSGSVAAATGEAPTRRYQDPLGWSLTYPKAWHVEHSRSPSYIRIDVREATVANFPLVSPISAEHDASSASMHIDAPRDPAGAFPADGVALRVSRQQGGPPVWKKPREARFPLHLASFRPQTAYAREIPRPVGRTVNVGGELYVAQAWIGPRASRTAQAKLARIVSSLAFRR
jgi:hypothetical protein